MMTLRNGREEGIPYSLSRWTDVPAAKWAWFLDTLAERKMVAFDPRTAVPSLWSMHPEDTLGLVFWTKDPSNIIRDRKQLRDYHLKIHVTVTGWEEVEKGAPSLTEGAQLLARAAGTFGPENVFWRFSPVPMVPDVVERFRSIASVASPAGVSEVFLAFLQENDLMPERRSEEERRALLDRLAEIGQSFGIKVLLCNDDHRLFDGRTDRHANLGLGICARPEDFPNPAGAKPIPENCGCVLMVDPFTINESCTFGCQYCYAADKSLSDKKRNTTRQLPIIRGT